MIGRWLGFARLLSGERRTIALSLALSVAQSALLVPIALLVRHTFDEVLPNGDRRDLVQIGAAILVLFVGSAVLLLWTRHAVLKATKEAVTRLRATLFERLFALPSSYYDDRDVGTLHSTVVQDTERLDFTANALVGYLLPAAVISVALAAALAVLNPLLFALLLAVAPVLVLLSRFMGRIVRARTRVWQRAFDAFSADALVGLRGMTLFKSHAAEELRLARQRPQLRELAIAGRTMLWMQTAYVLVNSSVAAAAGVVVLIVGGAAVIDGRMTLGDLLSFYALVALLRTQMTSLLWAVPAVLSGGESLERLRAILEAPDREPYAGSRPIDFRGGIAVERVAFAYRAGEEVLSDVSLEVAPGEVVAVIGPNGAGKSTLARLVVGLYRPTRGRIVADGVPLDELDLRALRRRIAVVDQDAFLFPASIRENIAALTPDATDEELAEAARIAGAHRFVSSLPEGYDTHAGDDGALLSGGQRQRIALARALLRRPSLLILDEPTSSLDDEGIAELLVNLRRLPGAPSVIVITHNTALVDVADRVYRIRDGRAVGMTRADAAAAGERP